MLNRYAPGKREIRRSKRGFIKVLHLEISYRAFLSIYFILDSCCVRLSRPLCRKRHTREQQRNILGRVFGNEMHGLRKKLLNFFVFFARFVRDTPIPIFIFSFSQNCPRTTGTPFSLFLFCVKRDKKKVEIEY